MSSQSENQSGQPLLVTGVPRKHAPLTSRELVSKGNPGTLAAGGEICRMTTRPISQLLILAALALSLLAPVAASAQASKHRLAQAQLRRQVVRSATAELGTGESPAGSNCQKYGPCMPWSGLFASWVLVHAGAAVAPSAACGDLLNQASGAGAAHPAGGYNAKRGDLIFFGQGGQINGCGIVTRSAGRRLTVISGNNGDAVSSFKLDLRRPLQPVAGFMTPVLPKA